MEEKKLMEFKHPNYYKELRKLRNKLDQAISHANSTRGPSDVRPDPGPKQQASSVKQTRTSSGSSFKRQATSVPTRVTSVKLQAASSKLLDS